MTPSEKACAATVAFYLLYQRKKSYYPSFSSPTGVKFHDRGLDKVAFAVGVNKLTWENINIYDDTDSFHEYQMLNDRPIIGESFELRHTQLPNVIHFKLADQRYFTINEDRYGHYYKAEMDNERFIRLTPNHGSENEMLIELS